MLGCVSSVCSELLNQLNCTESLAGDKDILKVSSVFVTKLEKRHTIWQQRRWYPSAVMLPLLPMIIQPWEEALKEKKLVGSRSWSLNWALSTALGFSSLAAKCQKGEVRLWGQIFISGKFLSLEYAWWLQWYCLRLFMLVNEETLSKFRLNFSCY